MANSTKIIDFRWRFCIVFPLAGGGGEGRARLESGLTIADALTVPAMRHAELLAGETGLQNQVRWVHILDIPVVVPWVSPGDLVLTSGYQFLVRPETVDELVPRLADKRVAGMIMGVGVYLMTVPRQMVVDANRRGFPLIQISSSIRFEDLTHQLISKLLYNPQQILQRADQAAAELTVAVGSASELQTLCDTIATILSKDVALSVNGGHVARSRGVSDAALKELDGFLSRGSWRTGQGPARSTPSRVDGRRLMLRPLVAGERLIGQLAVLADTDFTPLDLLNVSHLAGLISVKLAVQRERQRALQSSRGDFLRQVLLSSGEEALDVRARGNLLGLREGEAYLVIAVRPASAVDPPDLAQARDPIVGAVGAVVPDPQALFTLDTESGPVMLVPLRGVAGGAFQVRDALQRAIRSGAPAVVAGLSDAGRSLAEAPSRLGQATRAADLARKLYGPGAVGVFSELRAFDLLDELAASRPDVEFTIVPGLRALFLADQEHGLNLVETVRTYLRSGGNLERTASRLFLHRNSVRYRIERARGFLGDHLSEPSQWMQLEMALAIHSLREPEHPQPGPPPSRGRAIR